MAYILGTGYFNGNEQRTGLDWFAKLWLQNSMTWMDKFPDRVICVSVGNSHAPYVQLAKELELVVPVDVIDLKGNPGHIHQLLGKQEPAKANLYCGVTSTFIALASLAYCNECDLIYKEQDCLAFGSWVAELYRELGTTQWGMAFGRIKSFSSAQSIFIVKDWFIPEFIRCLIVYGDEHDIKNLPEDKFLRLMAEHPETVKQFRMGYDRDRPFNVKDAAWSAQKLTPLELVTIQAAGLIELPDNFPYAVECFTNNTTGRFSA